MKRKINILIGVISVILIAGTVGSMEIDAIDFDKGIVKLIALTGIFLLTGARQAFKDGVEWQ